MTTTERTELPPGIYSIYVKFSTGPEYLTWLDEGVTILRPISLPKQEWRVVPGKDGKIIIEWPSKTPPGSLSYLTYDGPPGKPKSGNQIVLQDSPLTEWHLAPGPGSTSLIRVADSDLGIIIGPPTIPPVLQLGHIDHLEWIFERVADE